MLSKESVTRLQKSLEDRRVKIEDKKKRVESTEYYRLYMKPHRKLEDNKELQFISDAEKLLKNIEDNYDLIQPQLTSDDYKKLQSIKDLVENLETLSDMGSYDIIIKASLISVGIGGIFLAMVGGLVTSPELLFISPELLVIMGLVGLGIAGVGYLAHWIGMQMAYGKEPAQMQIATSGNFDLAIDAVKEMQKEVNLAITHAQNPNIPTNGEEALKRPYEELVPVYGDVLHQDSVKFLPKTEGLVVPGSDNIGNLSPVYIPKTQ